MYDFTSGASAPVPVRVDGARTYQVQRFLLPEFEARVASSRQRQIDEFTEGMSKHERAQFLALTPPVPVDIYAVWKELVTPEGIRHVIQTCMAKSGVPQADIDIALRNDPMILRRLADDLSSADATIAELEGQAERGFEPEAGDSAPKPPSGGPTTAGSTPSPETGAQTSTGSTPPSTAQIQAA
ncbi:MAG TPA: hypothetical protein VGN72_01100 [Tepidisphaeraceae bacterium]|jgi:hypothetical protein|nr:hypothetical protein [Tepidisphaeraceae bacterium]